MLLHLMVFAFGFMNYIMKVYTSFAQDMSTDRSNFSQDTLSGPRETFGPTYAIARSAALVLHVDIALILFREYQASFLRDTMLTCRSCLPHTYIIGTSNASERRHTVRYALLPC